MILADVWQSLFHLLAASWLGAEKGARQPCEVSGAQQLLRSMLGALSAPSAAGPGAAGAAGSPPRPGIVPPAARCFPSQAFSLAGLWGQRGSQASGVRKSVVLPACLPRSTAISTC